MKPILFLKCYKVGALWVLIFLFGSNETAWGQQKLIDSLQKALLAYPKRDTSHAKALNGLAAAYYVVNADSAISIGTRNRLLCQYLAYPAGEGEALRVIGLGYNQKGEYNKAIEYYQQSRDILQRAGKTLAIAKTLNSLGNTYKNKGDYFLAITILREGLKIWEKHQDKRGMSTTLNNIGNIYYDQEEYKTAVTFYQQSISLKEEIGDKFGLPMILNNTGGCYMRLGEFEKALAYHQKSIEISQKNGDKRVWAMNLHCIGEVYRRQGKFDLALQKFQKSTELKLALKDKWGLMYDLYAMAEVHKALEKPQRSIELAEEALRLAKEIKSPKEYKEISKLLYENYKQIQQYDKALAYFEAHKSTSDSLYNIDKAKAINNLEAKVALEKKEQEIQQEKQASAFQRVILYLVLAGLVSMGIFAFYIYRGRQVQKRLNVKLEIAYNDLQQHQEEIISQRDLIEHQKENLEQKNHQITSSIKTALVIQKAILPFDNRMRGILKDYFVLYQPRDIVSGDFYWIERVGEDILVVVGDCTGHGVPGAFMSLIAINLLEKVVLQQDITEPPAILRHLHEAVRASLKQDEIGNDSGMDVGIVKISPNNILHFSGAKRPLHFIHAEYPNEVQVCGGSRKSIGGIQNEAKDFEEVMMRLPVGSTFYLSSDGLADQNNTKRKRLKDEPILKTLLANYPISMEAQKQAIQTLLDNHMKDTEQRDDIVLLGVKL